VPRFDGLELFFGSNRSGTLGGLDLWAATRRSVTEPGSAPVNLVAVNSVSGDQRPYVGSDRQTLYFASGPAVGLGGLDLYVTTVEGETGNESPPCVRRPDPTPP
jgi:hypothetical protein